MGSSVSKKEQKKTGGKPKKRRKKKKYELETAGSQVQGSGREMALVSRVRICTLCVCVCVHVCECVYRPQSLACHHGHIIIDTKIIIIIIIPIIIIIIVIIVIIVIIIIINITAVKGSAVLVASFIALLYKKNTSQRGPAKRKRRGRGGGERGCWPTEWAARQHCDSALLLLLVRSKSMAMGSLQFDFGDDSGCWFLDETEDDEVVDVGDVAVTMDGTPVMPSIPRASSSCWFRFMALTYCCCKCRWYISTVAFSSCHTYE